MTRHMRNYAKVRRMVEAHYANLEAEYRKDVDRLKALLGRVRAGEEDVRYESGVRCREDGLVSDIARAEMAIAGPWRGKPRKGTVLSWLRRDIERLDAADAAGAPDEIEVRVRWSNSKSHGMTPHAESTVWASGGSCWRGEGTACGCGYDKLSAAVNDALTCPAMDRFVVEHDRLWGCYAVEGRNSLPHLSFGGKGTGTLRRLFEEAKGWEFTWRWGKDFDYIRIAKKGK